jgi:hypothetical protein
VVILFFYLEDYFHMRFHFFSDWNPQGLRASSTLLAQLAAQCLCSTPAPSRLSCHRQVRRWGRI